MSQVSGTRESTPSNRPTSRPQGQKPAKPEDVRAMSDAFAAARAKMKFEGLPGKQAKPMLAKGMVPEADRKMADAALGAAFDRKLVEQKKGDRQADGQGMSLPGQPAGAPPVQLAAMPSPQVDPGAFAQMLADLWTRENGKGAREVRVKFGADAWPTTDATLVRNAAGTLDIAIGVATGRRGPPLEELGAEMASSGLAIGALEIVGESA